MKSVARFGQLLSRLGSSNLQRSAGQAVSLETLEQRLVLDGVPGLADGFNNAQPLTINGAGVGTFDEMIDTIGDDDLYRLQVTSTDFVRILADAAKGAGQSALDFANRVDTRLELYSADGVLIRSATGNGSLTAPQALTEAFIGFVPAAEDFVAGTATYYIRVLSDQMAGPTATGDYTLRVNAQSDGNFPAVNPAAPAAVQVTGNFTRQLQDRVFRINNGSNFAFDSLATLSAIDPNATFDTRLDLHDSTGNLIIADSQSGALTNAFLTFKGEPNETYYVRLRSDQFGPTTAFTQNGVTVVANTIAEPLTVDPVRRLNQAAGRSVDGGGTELTSFIAQGSGRTIASVGLFPPPFGGIGDPSLTIFNSDGVLLGRSNDFFGDAPQLDFALVAGQRYYMIVDNFTSGGALYNLTLETNHTSNEFGNVDDHANAGQFELATPIVWQWAVGGALNGSNATVSHDPSAIAPPAPPPFTPSTDKPNVLLGQASGRIGTPGDTDLFLFVPPVDMLADFDGRDVEALDNRFWWPGFLPSTRVEIQLVPFAPDVVDPQAPVVSYLTSPSFRVFDSNGVEVYNNTNQGFFLGLGPGAGARDPSRYPANFVFPDIDATDFTSTTSFEVWGGEPYYIEVSDGNTGRYTLHVIVDAAPDPTDTNIQFDLPGDVGYTDGSTGNPASSFVGTGALDSPTSIIRQSYQGRPTFPIPAEVFAGAPELSINTQTGGTRTSPGAANGYFDSSAPFTRVFSMFGGGVPLGPPDPSLIANPNVIGQGMVILHESTGLTISHPLETNLFQFEVERSGFAEIRINTTNLQRSHTYTLADFLDDQVLDAPPMEAEGESETKTKTINSLLQSALRIFNNDLQEIGYAVGNDALRGTTSNEFVGSFGQFTFTDRDARIVIPVTRGERYFIQVESGQLANFQAHIAGAGDDLVSWQNLIGAYEMLVHTVADPNGPTTDQGDDFRAFFEGQGVAANSPVVSVPIAFNGTSTFTGVIANSVNNPADRDGFSFIAPATSDSITLTVSRQGASTVLPDVQVFGVNALGGIDQLASGTAGSTGSITLNFSASKGARIFIDVGGGGLSQGAYQVSISGLSQVDDHDNYEDIFSGGGTPLQLVDFQGSGTDTGIIRSNGDSDVFTVTADDFTDLQVSVTSATSNLFPQIDVYEVSVDPFGSPILLRIARTDNTNGGLTESVRFSITPDRTSVDTGLTYPLYYIVVTGEDRQNDEGSYTINVTFPPTDDHADNGEFVSATIVPVDTTSGAAGDTGIIEVESDTDLFTFSAPAGGQATITVTTATNSLLNPRLTILDSAGNPVLAAVNGVTTATLSFPVVRGEQYFVLVGVSSVATEPNTTGAYSFTLQAPPIDDHPNAGEFDLATNIPLAADTGDGQLGSTTDGAAGNPEIAPLADTDLFTFVTRGAGNVVVTVTPANGSTPIRPRIELFDANRVSIGSALASAFGNAITFTVSNAAEGARYYLLVSDNAGTRIGDYQIVVDGAPAPDGGGGGGGGGGNMGPDFDSAQTITLDPFRADGQRSGVIDTTTEQDVYRFVSPGTGRVFVQVLTPSGSLLDARASIYFSGSQNPVFSDALGIPGTSAALQFDVGAPGTEVFIVIDSVGGSLGSYTVRVDAPPAVHQIFYPEGFTGSTIREFVSISNPNDFAVTYTVKLRYEVGDRDQVIVLNKVIGPGRRGGVTLSNGEDGSPVNVREGTPYSVIIESDGPLAATMARYDFQSAIGDAFTDRIDDTWTFGRVERDPGSVFDFIVFYNPHDFAVDVTLRAYTANGTPVTSTFRADAQRRGGWNINDLGQFPTGIFGVTVTSAPVDQANAANYQGIVAALSHFNVTERNGFGLLGDTDFGGTAGAVTSLTQGGGTDAEFVIFNPNNTTATVTLRGQYVSAALPDLVRTLSLAPRETLRLNGSQLGLVNAQPLGLTYTSNVPVSVVASERQLGESNASSGAVNAGTGLFFGDAFINTALAGQSYFETLSFYNPASIATEITVELLFSDGTTDSFRINLAANDFTAVNLHQLLGSAFLANTDRPSGFDASAVLGRPGLNFFSISVTAPTPIVANLTHYDLFLRGGWGNAGGVFGLTNLISSIQS